MPQNQNPASSPSPSWLTPPELLKAAPARVIPRAEMPAGLFRLLPKKFTKEEWEGVKTMFREHPDRRIKPGAPHPDRPGVFFIRYHRPCKGGESWGTQATLASYRKSTNECAKRRQKERMQTDPEFRAKQLASLVALVDKRKSREGAIELEKAEKKAWREKAKGRGYFKDYYEKNKPALQAKNRAAKAKRREIEGKPPAKAKSPKPARLTKAERHAVVAEKFRKKKEAKAARD